MEPSEDPTKQPDEAKASGELKSEEPTADLLHAEAETVKKGARITGADREKLAGELTKKYAK